jgi:hypothetical protein
MTNTSTIVETVKLKINERLRAISRNINTNIRDDSFTGAKNGDVLAVLNGKMLVDMY